MNRRNFLAAGIVALPLTGCGANRPTAPAQDPLNELLGDTKANLSPDIIEDVSRAAGEMRSAQRTVLDHPVRFDVAPRFFPSFDVNWK